MEVCRVNHQIQENDSISKMIRENTQILYSNVDYHCLRLYDETNEHFSMAIITENREGEEEQAVGYNCIYRYETHRIKLEFDIKDGLWKYNQLQFKEEHCNLPLSIIENIQFLTLDEQIQMIIQRLNQYFTDIDIDVKTNNNIQAPIPTSIFNEEHLLKYPTDELIEMNTQHIPKSSLAIPEDDDIIKDSLDYGFHGFITNSRNNKFSGLAPPPVAPRRSRQNSACSTQSSVRYASFMPPPSAPVRRRRVIESIIIYVQRRRKPFEKIVDMMRGIQNPTMYDLGLEFLRVYDGKFNYREGHTFVMSFRKKTWFLTIEKINCVDCGVGEIGPRSLLKLNYKGQIACVHV